METQIIKLFIV